MVQQQNQKAWMTAIMFMELLPRDTRRRRVSAVRYFEREHIHITLIKVYFYNCSILLLIIVANLLLHLIYKLDFVIGIYVQEKTEYMQGSVKSAASGIHLGCWNLCLGANRGLLYLLVAPGRSRHLTGTFLSWSLLELRRAFRNSSLGK